MKRISRQTTRDFLSAVEWLDGVILTYLSNGAYNKRELIILTTELNKMTLTKRVPPIRRISGKVGRVIYTHRNSQKKRMGTFLFDHNRNLRKCLAKYIHDRGGLDYLSISNDKNADACFNYPDYKLYIEFDSGTKNREQLIQQMKRYKGEGAFRVLYFCQNEDDKEHLEINRLTMISEIANEVLKGKPNRFCGACFTAFLNDGRINNSRGENG